MNDELIAIVALCISTCAIIAIAVIQSKKGKTGTDQTSHSKSEKGENDMKFKSLNKNDVTLIIGIGALAAILSVYPFPFVAAGAVAIGIILVRMTDSNKTSTTEQKTDTPDTSTNTTEQRTAQEIINNKLNGGAIEHAIDQKFDKMVNEVVSDLFGNYGDITRDVKKKLKETMNPYIEQYDFSQHNTKLEHVLNNLVGSITKDQDQIIRNVKNLMGVEPVTEITSSELFNKYTKFIAEEIETDDLEINYDDEPSYEPLTASLSTEDEHTYSSIREEKTLTFTCDEDEKLNLTVNVQRWVNDSILGDDWKITSVHRESNNNKPRYAFRDNSNTKDITSLELPLRNLRDLNDLEVYLLKLHYDRTTIVLDETEIDDDDIEIDAEPEVSFS